MFLILHKKGLTLVSNLQCKNFNECLFSPQPYFSFHKPHPPRIAIRCHQQACRGDDLQNNPLGPQTLLRSLLHYECFWPR